MKNNKKIKLERTKEGTIFEIVSLVLISIMWTIIMVVLNQSGEAAATDTHNIITNGLTGTGAALLCLFSAYFPGDMINLPFKIKRPAQYIMMARMARTLAVEIVLLFIALILWHGENDAGELCFIIMIAAILITVIAYSFIIYRK